MSYVKAVFALFGLLLLVFVLLLFSGAFTEIFFKDQLQALQQQGHAAAVEIQEQTQLKANIGYSIKSSFGSAPSTTEIVVTYEFIPPHADRPKLYRAAEAAVRKNFKGLEGFRVTNIPNPDAAPPVRR